MPLVGKGQKGIKELRGRGPAVEDEAESQRMKGSGSGSVSTGALFSLYFANGFCIYIFGLDLFTEYQIDFSGGSESQESACNAGDSGLIPGLGRSPGGGHGNQFQYSCLENSMYRAAWQVTVHGVAKSRTWLSD